MGFKGRVPVRHIRYVKESKLKIVTLGRFLQPITVRVTRPIKQKTVLSER